MPANKTMRIEMVADVVCPYCHIGLKRLLGAIAAASGASAAAVEVVYTPFILRRHLPKEGVDKRTAFKQQYGNDAHGERILANIKATAAADGLRLDLTGQRAGNSEDAHRLLLWSGGNLSLFEAMVKSYNEESPSGWLGDHGVLLRAVESAGLDVAAAKAVLADDSAYANELEAGLERSAMMGVSGVPAFFVDGQPLGAGALDEEDLKEIIESTCK